MHDLEAAALAIPRRGEVALVSALALQAEVFEGDIADLEDLDRYAVMFVLSYRFEQPREQGRAHDLILRCLWIR